MKYLVSSFSLQMVPEGAVCDVQAKASLDEFLSFSPVPEIIIGHEGTAKALALKMAERKQFAGATSSSHYTTGVGYHSHDLPALEVVEIPVRRDRITLQPGDQALVAQIVGERLAVGAEVSEPQLNFFLVTIYGAGSKIVSRKWFERANNALYELSES